MKVKNVWSVWFSATDTTRKVTTTIGKEMSRELDAGYQEYSFNLPEARKKELRFAEDDLVVLGVPVYAGRVPNLLMPYVRDMIHGNGTLAVPVVLYGNRNFDDGLMELRNLMYENGFIPLAAGAFVGEHSFSKILGAGRPDEEDMRLVSELAAKAAGRVKELTALPDKPVAVKGCDPIRPYYTPRDKNGNPINILKAKPKTDPEKCINCGLCAKICTMGSIDFEDVSSVPGKCIKCGACIKKCPREAKYFDDPGYLIHKNDLEEVYGPIRAESEIFL